MENIKKSELTSGFKIEFLITNNGKKLTFVFWLKRGDESMQCKCIANLYGNENFTLGRIYSVKENVGIWSPILCRFGDWDNPGKLFEGLIFEFAMIPSPPLE